VAGERTNVGASLSGDRGREVEDELIGGDGGTERERVGEGGGGRTAPTALAHGAARERGLGLAPIGGTRLSYTGGARARARTQLGLLGWLGPKWPFPFFLEYLLPFLFIFSRVFNSTSNQVSNSNQIKYVQ
jgi:hypothetical protein